MSLTTLHLPAVLRAVAELAEAANQYRPEDHREILAAQADPGHTEGSPDVDVQFRWHDALDRIVETANRLKRALGATGKLDTGCLLHKGPPPQWPNFATEFADLDYSRPVRIGLRRLSLAAIDLSGYGAMKQPPKECRRRALTQLGRGVAQVWPALSRVEKAEVRDLLPELRRCFGWPGKPREDPPAWCGPTEIDPAEEYRVIDLDGFYTRHKEYPEEMQQASIQALIETQAATRHAARGRDLPVWSPVTRQLSFRGTVIRDYAKKRAPNQEMILSAFQNAGWPRGVQSGLKDRQLKDTVDSFNDTVTPNTIRLVRGGNNGGVLWERVGAG